jgi:carboxyl-terminal processing protease
MRYPKNLAALLLAVPLAAAPHPPFPALGREVVEVVRQNFLNAQKAARWATANAGYADEIAEPEAFHRATRDRLAQLGTSHTQYYTPEDVGYHELLAIFAEDLKRPVQYEGIGADLVERDGAWFVARTFPNSPAERAGLRRGDRIATADGAPFSPRRSFAGKAGREVALGVERRRGEPLVAVQVTPRRIQPREEWLAAQREATRVLDFHGHRIAYALVWVCAGEEPQRMLADALAGPLAGAEALVLDFRGGWGGCDLSFPDLWNPTSPELTRIDREGRRSTFASSWKKPLVLLIDGGTRSGKEVVARTVQRHHLGTLVGERTAGAVVAGRPYLLADGSLLLLAVDDILVDGEHLEGKGVAPDIAVPAELRYAEGRDPQLERALDVALKGASSRLSGAGRSFYWKYPTTSTTSCAVPAPMSRWTVKPPLPSVVTGRMALLVRVWPAPKLSALASGAIPPAGKARRSPPWVGETAVKLTARACAVVGMPQRPARLKVRSALAAKAGPP